MLLSIILIMKSIWVNDLKEYMLLCHFTFVLRKAQALGGGIHHPGVNTKLESTVLNLVLRIKSQSPSDCDIPKEAKMLLLTWPVIPEGAVSSSSEQQQRRDRESSGDLIPTTNAERQVEWQSDHIYSLCY